MRERLSSVNGLTDIHAHCGGMDLSNFFRYKYPYCQDIRDLESKRVNGGVDYVAVFPMPTTAYYDIPTYWRNGSFIASGYCDYPFELENLHLCQEIEHFRLYRLLPFLSFSLNAKIEKQIQSIRNLASQYPIYGLKYHTKVDQNNPTSLLTTGKPFLQLAQDLNIPLMIHCSIEPHFCGSNVISLAKQYPHVRFCCAHFGGLNESFCKELSVLSEENLFFDTAPLTALCRQMMKSPLRHLAEKADYSNPISVMKLFYEMFPTRILWGTDAPWYEACDLRSSTRNELIHYESESFTPNKLGLCEQLEINTNRFLFGKGV